MPTPSSQVVPHSLMMSIRPFFTATPLSSCGRRDPGVKAGAFSKALTKGAPLSKMVFSMFSSRCWGLRVEPGQGVYSDPFQCVSQHLDSVRGLIGSVRIHADWMLVSVVLTTESLLNVRDHRSCRGRSKNFSEIPLMLEVKPALGISKYARE